MLTPNKLGRLRDSLRTPAVASIVTGDPVSLLVRNATPFDVQNSKADGTGVNIGPDGNGWVAEIVFKGLATGGSFDATKISLTVSDPGFDASGNATSVTRTIVGGKVLRQQLPNQANSAIYASGADVMVQFSLSENIYAGTTIVGASAAAGAYTGSNAKAIGTVTNNSTLAYPKPLFAWLNQPYERATGTSLAVEGVAFHAHARNGRQVAAVAYTATDSTTTTSPQVAASAALSSIVTVGNIPEAYKATIPLASLTQGATCTLAAKVYPWIGDASAVLDLAATGAAFPTALAQAKLPFVCDRTGAYGGAYACVKVGATGGTVSATLATARAAPFPDVGAAWNALKVFNNANKGHNDIGGGIVYLMDAAGAASTHTMTTSSASPGAAWCEVQADPANTAAVSITWPGGNVFVPQQTRWGAGINLVGKSGNRGFLTNDSTAGNLAFDGCTVDHNSATVFVDFVRRTWWRNITLINNNMSSSGNFGPYAQVVGMTRGAGCTTSAPNFAIRTTIGVNVPGGVLAEAGAPSASNDSNDGSIVYNNLVSTYNGANVLASENYVKGFAFVQNCLVFPPTSTNAPFTGTGGGNIQISFSADGTTNAVDNFVDMHNTILERGNRLYNDVDGTAVAPSGMKKRGVSRYNLWNNWNQKQDCFTGQSALRGRVGGWEYAWGVNNRGNVDFYGSKQGAAPAAGPDHYLGEYWEPGSLYNASTQSTVPTFVNDQSTNKALTGDYHLSGASNTAYGRVRSGEAALAFDLGGAARKNDGTGAAGAYERTV